MDTVIYFSNSTLKVVSGQAGKGQVKIKYAQSIALPDRVLINGIITDEQRLRESLAGLQKSGLFGNRVTIVIDSSNILYRTVEIPFMKPAQILKTVQLEFDNLDTQYEEQVFDYAVLENRIGGENRGRILCCAMGRPMLDSYRTLFASIGVQIGVCDMGLNSVIKAISLYPALHDSSYILVTIEQETIICYLFARQQYIFSNRYRLTTTPDTDDYAAEIASRLSAINQFYKSEKGSVSVEHVYFTDISDKTLALCEQAVSFMDMKAHRLADSPAIFWQGDAGVPFRQGNYLAAIGGLIRK